MGLTMNRPITCIGRLGPVNVIDVSQIAAYHIADHGELAGVEQFTEQLIVDFSASTVHMRTDYGPITFVRDGGSDDKPCYLATCPKCGKLTPLLFVYKFRMDCGECS